MMIQYSKHECQVFQFSIHKLQLYREQQTPQIYLREIATKSWTHHHAQAQSCADLRPP